MDNLERAKNEFLSLIQTLDPSRDRPEFLKWLQVEVLPCDEKDTSEEFNTLAKCKQYPFSLGTFPFHAVSSARVALSNIADYVRRRLEDASAVLPTETIVYKEDTVSVDAFLYDQEDEDRLAEEGKLSRAVCTKCGSMETRMLRK